VREIVRKWLQVIQKLETNDAAKRLAFCEEVLGMMERDGGLLKSIISTDEVTFHLFRKVDRHGVQI
jgi:hypothetical protein